eukprot:6187561-Pleurochrysis_carterae.AAC.1
MDTRANACESHANSIRSWTSIQAPRHLGPSHIAALSPMPTAAPEIRACHRTHAHVLTGSCTRRA